MRSLPQQWIEAKEAEARAIAQRRAVEDQMIKANLREAKGYRIRIAERDNWRVDSDKLQTLAEAHGLNIHLSTLFRWKPEVDMRQWRSADGKITKPLLPAITITPGRPSFTITKED